MIAQERHQCIRDMLARNRKATIEELQTALGASPATLRRDLAGLEASGQLIRVRGAVVHPGYFRGEPTLAQKSRAAGEAKARIAEVAAELVPTGATVLLDAGSTCLALGRRLLARPDLTLVTHSLPLAALACQGETAARVVCLGGEVRSISGALVGALALSWLAPLRADWCFVSASGLTIEGASTTELAEAAMKQELLKRSNHPVLLADARKWNRAATVQFAAWRDLEIWITDAPDEAVRQVETHGLRVMRSLSSTKAE